MMMEKIQENNWNMQGLLSPRFGTGHHSCLIFLAKASHAGMETYFALMGGTQNPWNRESKELRSMV